MDREEAIERIKTRFDKWALDNEDMKAIQTLIPELNESEDERIRKEIKHHISLMEYYRFQKASKEECLAYLEKQNAPLTPEEKMNHPLYLEGFDVGRQVGEVVAKPAEWSEEDELRERFRWKPSEEQMEALKYTLGEGGKFDKAALESLYNDLKKL